MNTELLPTELLQSVEAEREILGNVLLREGKSFPEVSSLLRPEDFYHTGHRAIWQTMTDMDRANVQIDCITLWNALKDAGEADRLKAMGGADYLAKLLAECISVTGAEFHAKRVALKARRRRWAMACTELALSSEPDDQAFCDATEAAFVSLTAQRTDSRPIGMKPALKQMVASLERRWENRDVRAVTGIATGFSQVDWLTQGWQASELTLIAARPGIGKSSYAMNCALAAASNESGAAGLVFSLEMSTEAIVRRIVASDSNMDGTKIRNGRLDQSDWQRVSESTSRLSDSNLWFDESSALTIDEVASRARRWRLTEAKDFERVFVIVDYLQLIRGRPQKGAINRVLEVGQISGGLKMLAKQLKCPVIALSQLNRSLESRPDKRPMLSDLRESGSLEQDADVIQFIYRDEVYNQATEKPGIAEIIIAKQRDGLTGTVELGWQPTRTRFVNLEENRREG